MIHGTNRARRPHDINRRRSAGNIMNLNKIFLSLPLSVSVCLSACLRGCVWALYRCDIEEERYLFNDIFSSFIFIWFARRPLVITLLSLLLSLDYFHFRCAVFFVDFLASPPSAFLFYRFVHIYSFHFGSCWKLSFRIRFFGDGFFAISNAGNVHELIVFLCDMNDDFWLNETDERTRTERDMIRI